MGMPRPVRNTKQLQNTTRYCFVVEGETEEAYLQEVLGVAKPNIIVNPACTDIYNLVKTGIKKLRGLTGFAKVFVLFDLDKLNPTDALISKTQGLLTALKQEQDKVCIICSVPLFEYILILHFADNHPPSIPDSEHALKKYDFDKHKEESGRDKLMTHLKTEKHRIDEMAKRLQTRDKQILDDLSRSHPLAWHERFNRAYSPNSNFTTILELFSLI